MSRCQFTARAYQDLEDILEFIAKNNPSTAVRVVTTLERKCQMLAQFPEMGSPRDDLTPGLRSFSAMGSYVIFYQLTGDGVKIVRVLHGGRDLPALFRP
jgi:toxin ParE1/3/4